MSLSHLSLMMLVLLTLLMASNARPVETISRDPRHLPLQLMTLLAPQVPASQRALYYPSASGYRQNIDFRPAIAGQPESRIGFALLLLLLNGLIDDRFDSSTAQQSISNPPAAVANNSPVFPMWPQLNRPRM